MVKAIIIIMILCYVVVFLISDPLTQFIFPYGNVAESYLKPIYLGIIFLSGLIVGCTYYIAKLIKGLKSEKLSKKEDV